MATPENPRKKYRSYEDVWELRDGAILLYKSTVPDLIG